MNFEDANYINENPEKINNIEINNTKPESINNTSEKSREVEMYSKIYHLRDTFLESERDYVKALLEKPEIVDLIIRLSDFSHLALYVAAHGFIEDIEYGKVKEENLERAEECITILLAAIQDETLRKELVRVHDSNVKDKDDGLKNTIPAYYGEEEQQQISRSR